MIAPVFMPPLPVLFGRTLFIAIVLLLAFTAAGQWRHAAAAALGGAVGWRSG